ncbi:MAG TPA: polysaccharide pyruvyl transferase family protein [Verrucomicrobiota bacterium]|nr:polysaccharide pyruvyl transferase family protein [Verrucomicrobiota bacterium]
MIHHVYANQSNVGDWLSAKGIQSLLAPHALKEHFCDEPFVPATLAALNQAGPEDFIVIGGGGLFMDYFVPFWRGFEPIAARVPFVIWGAGACDMKLEKSRPPLELVTDIVRRSRLCIVRDGLTRGLLSGCNLPAPVICPTVAAVRSVGGETKRLLHVDHYDNVGAEVYEKMVSVTEAFAQRTGRICCQTNNLIPAGHNGALQKSLALYAAADLIVTSRLHGCIIGLATGRRVLAVSGDHKVDSFMNAAGLGDWVCGLDDIESLPARLERLHEQRPPVEFIEEGRRQNRAVAERVIALLAVEDEGRERGRGRIE